MCYLLKLNSTTVSKMASTSEPVIRKVKCKKVVIYVVSWCGRYSNFLTIHLQVGNIQHGRGQWYIVSTGNEVNTQDACPLFYRCVTLDCLAGAVLTHWPLTAATQVRQPASACEMVMWSPSQTAGFPQGTPVSSHTKTIRTHTSVPTSMINISCITCFVIVVK